MASLAESAEASSSRVTAVQQQQQVPLTLKTSIPDLSLPPTSYLVPTNFSRAHLSTLVNRLLAQTANLTTTVPFDFIADGQLLRESLESWLDKNGKTVEEGIELEYIKSTLPPKWAGSFEHDDWVASIDASREGTFLTASYDSCIRLFSYASPQEAVLTHKVVSTGSSAQSLVDAKWLGSSSRIVTAAVDGTVRIFTVPEANFTSETPGQIPGAGRTAMGPSALTSLSVSPDGEAVLSASRDGSVGYWKVGDVEISPSEATGVDDQADEDAKRKRRKGVNGKASSALQAKKPSALLWHSPPALLNNDVYAPSNNARVSQAVFSKTSSEVAYSAGYDGKVVEWDLFGAIQGGNPKLSQKTSDKVILCLDSMSASARGSSSSAVCVTGHMDRSIGIWDMRSASANISLLLPNAHGAPVYTVSSHPQSPNLLCSASGDGVVKLFDTRSPRRALFSLARPQAAAPAGAVTGSSKEKLLASAWDCGGQVVLAGGEDCKVNIFRGEGIGIERPGLA
ncbi:WD40 repeat-like protein [Microstroma glucosiphilum]|uniref:WD40 repeat-like protein n=1 Tax=Pseudomicrostroma glucosiphilum TaxID=1684307 RepID=A0A316U9H7_9BASI|nr:WD40 repeat-like protein [Pseudomicrostroma glucosiphilum]PWN21053.1 WD40 repeat-like protein [Pseudomicrostroma glucosiphilum]